MRYTHKANRQEGDTLVEVLLVIAVLSMIIVGANLLMNRAFGGTQAALEQTIVRQAVDGQVEMLAFARDQAIKAPGSPAATIWQQAVAKAAPAVSPYGSCLGGGGSQRFYLSMTGGSVLAINTNPTAANGIAEPGRGIWLELQRASAADNYVDAHAYACWEAPVSGPNMTTGTVVRLYVP